jgi:release factor glutamine methyltransferase
VSTPSDTRVGLLIEEAAGRLSATGSDSARLDAQLLLGRVTGWSRAQLLAHPEWTVPEPLRVAFDLLVARRAAAEPIAYLLGEREFFGRVFRVDTRGLIPRPETELLVELGVAAVARCRAEGVEPRVVEVGTGSGALAISVSLEARVAVVGTDLSWEALTLARENARLHAADGVRLVQADLLAGLHGPLHVVLANLPYVPSGRLLPAEVGAYEPHVALFGGERGTELIERFLAQACGLLAPGAEVCVELDEQAQSSDVTGVARSLFPAAAVAVHQDNGGYDRVVRVALPPR